MGAPTSSTVIVPYNPQPGVAFTFQPTLDGNLYSVTITSNIYRGCGLQSEALESLYFNLYDLSGNLIVSRACVASGTIPGPFDISLTYGFFTSTIYWRKVNNNFEVNP